MFPLVKTALLSLFFALAIASPAEPPGPPEPKLNKRRDITDIRNAYRGIYWDDALSQCSESQFNILVEGTRMALVMTNLAMDKPYTTPGWNRYFVNDWRASAKNGWHASQSVNTYYNIINNMKQVGQFPRWGRKDAKGNYVRAKQVSYRCKEVLSRQLCANGPDYKGQWTGATAYVANPAMNPEGWAIVFCPRFFQDGSLSFIEEITSGAKNATEIGSLKSYEYAIIHEWMHCDIFGYKIHMADIEASLKLGTAPVDVYGDENCHEFAWKFMNNKAFPGGKINPHVAFNADNYAWFFSYHWFGIKWGWTSDGSFTGKKDTASQEPNLFEDLAGPSDENSLDVQQATLPINCHPEGNVKQNNPIVTCDYVGEDYNDFLKDSKQPFVARNSTCILSAACNIANGYGINAACTCTCEGKVAAISDPRCEGFAGALPNPNTPGGQYE